MPCQRYPPNSVQANLPAPEIEKARCCFGGCILKATRISHHFQAWKVHFPWSASLSSCKRLRIGSNKSIQRPSNRPQHTGQKDNASRNLLEDRKSGSRNKRPRETSIFQPFWKASMRQTREARSTISISKQSNWVHTLSTLAWSIYWNHPLSSAILEFQGHKLRLWFVPSFF